MKHEHLCVTYDYQIKSRGNNDWGRWRMLFMNQYIDTLPLSKSPSNTTLPKSEDIYLEDDDDHQGERKKKEKK
jgi:hypothetical protein